ncbi:MAG: calcium/sodium antiporter [Alphaproteobacteria bacterium]|nr:calcium/sodium antiporter [Alphaproteobacteria bacterium]
MTDYIPYIAVAGGLVLLLISAEILIRGAVGVSRRMGISPLVVGITVIAFGTSAPELAVSVDAALAGAPGLVVGNIVGSNIANILLLIGLVGLVTPFGRCGAPLPRDGLVLIIATLVMLAVTSLGEITRLHGIVMVSMIAAYLVWCYKSDRKRGQSAFAEEVEEFDNLPSKGWLLGTLIVLGLVGVVCGGHFVVSGAVEIAARHGVSDTVIGLTIVALGTSLPELATAVVAAYRKHSDMAFGNIIGSNIFNILAILGIAAITHPIAVPEMGLKVWFMAAVTFVFLALVYRNSSFGRPIAAAFFLAYALFTFAQYRPLSVSALALQ